MKKPTVLIFYEKLLPGSQLVNRLEDRGYIVRSVSPLEQLPHMAENEMPLLAIVDIEPRSRTVCQVIADLKQKDKTSHLPVIAISSLENKEAQEAARNAGATLVVADSAIVLHLDQFLEQALEI